MSFNRIFDFFLLASAVAVWLMMLGLRLAEYDANVLCFMIALLISGFASATIAAAWFIKRQVVKDSMLSAVLFAATSSPPSIFVFLWLFVEFVGNFVLKH